MKKNLFILWFIASLILLSFLFFQGVPKQVEPTGQWDKVAHFVAFFGLAFICHHAFSSSLLVKIIGLSFYGGFVEVVQSYIPHRMGSWLDLLADIAGVLIFFIVNKLVIKHLLKTKTNQHKVDLI